MGPAGMAPNSVFSPAALASEGVWESPRGPLRAQGHPSLARILYLPGSEDSIITA